MNLTSNIEQFHQQWLRDGAVQHILQNNENTDGIERCIAMIRNKRTEWNALMDLKNKLKYVTCSYVRRQSEYYHFCPAQQQIGESWRETRRIIHRFGN